MKFTEIKNLLALYNSNDYTNKEIAIEIARSLGLDLESCIKKQEEKTINLYFYKRFWKYCTNYKALKEFSKEAAKKGRWSKKLYNLFEKACETAVFDNNIGLANKKNGEGRSLTIKETEDEIRLHIYNKIVNSRKGFSYNILRGYVIEK